MEKWAQGDIKDDDKNGSPSTKEIDQQDTKKEKNNRPKDCIGKRAFLLEKEICGTVKFQGKPVGGGKLLYGIETVTSSLLLYGYNLGKDISRFLIVMSFVDVEQVFVQRANRLFSPLYSIGKCADIFRVNQ